MDRTFGVHPKLVQIVNAAGSDALVVACKAVLNALLGDADDVMAPDLDRNLVDAVSLVYSTAVVQRTSPEVFRQYLSTETPFLGDAVSTLATAYEKAMTSSVAAAASHSDVDVLNEGFFPRVTGVSWSVSHALGDRMNDPPSRSVPQFDVELATTHPANGEERAVHMTLPAERLVDLHTALLDMMREAERIAKLGK